MYSRWMAAATVQRTTLIGRLNMDTDVELPAPIGFLALKDLHIRPCMGYTTGQCLWQLWCLYVTHTDAHVHEGSPQV